MILVFVFFFFVFFFNDTATTEIYTLSLHDALPRLHVRPLRGHDRVQHRVAQAAVAADVLVAQDALADRAEPRDRRLRALVADVGLDRDAVRSERLERVAEEQQLGLRVDRGSPPRPPDPGAADLERAVALVDVAVRRHADRPAARRVDLRERERDGALAVEDRGDVGLALRPRPRQPRPDAIVLRGREQVGDVAVGGRLEHDVLAAERDWLDPGHRDRVSAGPSDRASSGPAAWRAARSTRCASGRPRRSPARAARAPARP